MDEQEIKFINLITHLPPNVNPYLAAADMLEESVHPASSPPWIQNFKVALLVLEEFMLLQCVLLLYQRLRISKYPKIKRNNLGLVIVNISYIAAFTYLLYSILAIYTLLAQIATEKGRRVDDALALLIFALRFFVVMVGSWAFLWVCACQCALILWNSDLASKMNRDRLKTLIQWISSILILFFAFGPLPSIAWQYIKVYEALRQIQSIAQHISSTLRSRAESYDPLNFNQLSLLSLLIPAKQMLTLRERLEDGVRLGQKIYLVDLSFLSLVYVPLLIVSLKHLCKQSKFHPETVAPTGSNQPSESAIGKRIRRQRQRLVFHAISVYIATSIHLPVLIYEIILSQPPGFSQTKLWWQLTFLGLTVPLSVTGNVTLLVLNLHSYLILRDRAHPRMQSLKAPPLDQSDMNIFHKAVTIVFGLMRRSEEDSFHLDDLETCENGRA